MGRLVSAAPMPGNTALQTVEMPHNASMEPDATGGTTERNSWRSKTALITAIGSSLIGATGILGVHLTSCSANYPIRQAGLICAVFAVTIGGYATPAIGWGQRVHSAAFFFGTLGALSGCFLFVDALLGCIT